MAFIVVPALLESNENPRTITVIPTCNAGGTNPTTGQLWPRSDRQV